jgi:hypothetical protein
LAKLVSGKLKALLGTCRRTLFFPRAHGANPGSSTSRHGAKASKAVLDYLARYVFRVAVTNSRIVDLDAAAVTIR